MRLERLDLHTDMPKLLRALGVDSGGISILSAKAKPMLFYISDLHVGAANILKQDALSVGADLAVPRGTVTAQVPRVDAVLIATQRQLSVLAKKELAQPFGLKTLAQELRAHLGGYRPERVEIMGIINANDDSFFSGSRFVGDQALEQIERMIEEGADIIDLGAVSTRPGSSGVSVEEELARIKPIVDAIKGSGLSASARFSIDSYTPEVIAYALEGGFTIVNDITGLAGDEICRLCAQYNAQAVIMHMQGTPLTMQHNPHYVSLIGDIETFFETRIEKAERFGIKELVLDVGIGFGKTLEHNCELVARLEHFLKLGYPLLVGASRKSMIDQIIPAAVEERLGGTLSIHLKAVQNGAQMLRVHDVKAHVQALRVWEALI